MKLKVSVIIPCYQSEKYIQRCLESVLSQTYTNLEIIVVDDGSTDSTAEIVNNISKTDKRVRYIYQMNSGVSVARNRGIDCASGDVVTFVDSDDIIKKDMYKTLIELMQNYDADITHCSYCRCYANGEIKNIGNTGKIYFFEDEDIALSLLEARLVAPGSCNKMYKKSILKEIRFVPDIRISEDLLFNFMIFQKARKAVFIDLCMYVYYSTETSACVNTNLIKKAEDVFKVEKTIYEMSQRKKYEIVAKKRLMNANLGIYKTYACNRSQEKEKMRLIRKQIIFDYNRHEYSGTKKKEAFIIKYIPCLLKPVYRVYDRIRTPNWDL